MIDFLYGVFISPLLWFMELIFIRSYEILNDYGYSLIILSVVVNILLVPLYHRADKWQEEERLIYNGMEPVLSDIKLAFKGQERFMMLRTLYRQHGYHPFLAVRNSFGFLIQVPFFFAAYTLLNHYEPMAGHSFLFIRDLSKPDALFGDGLNVLPVVMTLINLWSASVYTKKLRLKDKIQLYGFALVFLLLLYNASSALLIYWTFNNVFSLIKNIIYVKFEDKIKNYEVSEDIKQKEVFSLFSGLFIILILILFYYPAQAYYSDPEFFSISISRFLISSFTLSGMILFLALMLILILPRFFVKLLMYAIVFLSITVLINFLHNFIDAGVLDNYVFSNAEKLSNRHLRMILDFGVWGIAGVVIIVLAIKKLWMTFAKSTISIAIFLMCYSAFIFYQSNTRMFSKETRTQEVLSQSIKIPSSDYQNHMLSFSKEKPNVLIMMLDTFTGQHLEDILSELKDLKEVLEGFTYYSDTISPGSNTLFGEPSVHGGYRYTPDAINERADTIDSLYDEIGKGYQTFVDDFGRQGFRPRMIGVQYSDCDVIEKYTETEMVSCNGIKYEYDFIEQYLSEHPEIVEFNKKNTSYNQQYFSYALGIYNIAPYVLRGRIYANGKWMNTVRRSGVSDYALKNMALSLFPRLVNDNSKDSTFSYIQVSQPHRTWLLNKDTCEIDFDLVNSYERISNGRYTAHYATELCSMRYVSEILDRMKVLDIYDNTMIVIVSDHGGGDDPKLSKTFGGDEKNLVGGYPGRPTALLLVKNINDRTPFKVNHTPMSVADTPAIVCSLIEGCKGIEQDPRSLTHDRHFIYSLGEWSITRHPKNKFNITEQYRINGSKYIMENWERIK